MAKYYTPAKRKFLGVSEKTVKRWKRDGKFVPDKVDNKEHIFYKESQLRKLLKSDKTDPASTSVQLVPIGETITAPNDKLCKSLFVHSQDNMTISSKKVANSLNLFTPSLVRSSPNTGSL